MKGYDVTKKQTLKQALDGFAEWLITKAENLKGAEKHDYMKRAKQLFERADAK